MDKPDKNIRNSPPDKASETEENVPSSSKPRTRGRKRKRQDSGSSTDLDVLPENALEVEKNLQNVALKNNLDDASMKKILKKVVTNDHVLALVKLREEEEIALSKEQNPKPKLTRAKAKELMGASPKSAPWNLELTPIKHIPVKTRPEVEALITKELPEDEDDDEYEPTHDDVPSDDDQTLESCSDFDSQPPTPGAPLTPQSLPTTSPRVLQDGPFKVPLAGTSSSARRKLVIVEEEEATIALRTRSKINLSATPIEHIESSFVPPDDVPMPIGDDLWNQFLEECLNPAETTKNEDDDEADPEYNVAADPDAHDEDEDNSILRISKKELNDLVTELFSIMPEDPATAAELAENLANNVLTGNNAIPSTWDGKQEPLSDEEKEKPSQTEQQKRDSAIRFSIGKSEPEDHYVQTEKENAKQNVDKKAPVVKTKPVRKGSKSIDIQVEEQTVSVQPAAGERAPPPLLGSLRANTTTTHLTLSIDNSVKMLPEQVLVLQQQLRMHVQLAASNFLQLYVNPAHWSFAPTYKEYLEQFNKMVESNPNSVTNVCNLKPALELVHSWESSVSKDTPENKEMVEYIQSEAERGRRRYAQNSLYVGNFPELFMKVVANSTVFQYPYLLPAMPYRADNNRKFGYRKPEDELIALGLDQFWQYVEDNPQMYKRPSNCHQKRWGLVATCNLMVKHMFPWLTSKWLQYHIHRVRKNKDNPIAKFFANREVTKVDHKLLPFNPKLTLYEQPEYEMPRLWVRYLAKTSKRFKYYYYKRAGTGAPPQGVSVNVDVQEPVKNPLPPDFTKTIVCNRYNVKPKIPEISQDNFDLVVIPQTGTPMLTVNPITSTDTCNVISTNAIQMGISNPDCKEEVAKKGAIPEIRPKINKTGNTGGNPKVIGTLIPVCVDTLKPFNGQKAEETKQSTPQTGNQAIAANMFSVIQTIHGAYLVPLTVQNTTTINSINTPIPSATVVGNHLPEGSKPIEQNDMPESSKTTSGSKETTRESVNNHCQCCVLLRKICKEKQSRITDFFKAKKTEEKPCECSHRKFPKITKRLRMLVDNFKSKSWCEQRRIKAMLSSAGRETNSKKDADEQQNERNNEEECSLEDIEYVTTFHMKLTRRSTLASNVYLKTRINLIFSKFDPEVDNPISLSESLFQAFGVEMVDLYKEFMGFLTPEQADQIDCFKDYFVHRCISGLVKKVEAEIENKENRDAILSQLNAIFTDNVSSSCELCSGILKTMIQYPRLAKYVFSLFPHRVVVREKERFEIENSPNKFHSNPVSSQPEKHPLETVPTQDTEASITAARLEEAEPVDNLTICDETLVVMDYEADDDSSSNDGKDENKTEATTIESRKNPEKKKEIKNEDPLIQDTTNEESTVEVSVISKTETHDTSESTVMSPLVMSEDEEETQIKSEVSETCEWKRDEDKYILQLLLEHVTPEARKDLTILEILEVKNVYQKIADKYPDKCIDDVKDRVMHILDILVLSEY